MIDGLGSKCLFKLSSIKAIVGLPDLAGGTTKIIEIYGNEFLSNSMRVFIRFKATQHRNGLRSLKVSYEIEKIKDELPLMWPSPQDF